MKHLLTSPSLVGSGFYGTFDWPDWLDCLWAKLQKARSTHKNAKRTSKSAKRTPKNHATVNTTATTSTTAMTDLFRPEAVAHQQQRLLGTIVLRQAWPTTLLALLFGGLVCALIAVFFLFGFARRETLAGRLLPEGGLIHTSSPQTGLVQQVQVREGQTVAAGDLLFVLSGERQGERGSTQTRVGAALTEQRELLGSEVLRARQQSLMNQSTLTNKLAQANRQLEQIQAGINLQRRRTALANSTYERYAGAEYSVVVSREKLDEKRAEAMDQEAKLHTLQREEAAMVAERNALQAELAALPVRMQREVAGIQGSLTSVRQAEAENDTRQRWEVRAPRAGRLTVVAAEVGQMTAASEVLASIAPEGSRLEAVLYAPSRAAGQLKAGMPAQLRFDALPYQKYGQFQGVVHEVSRSPVPAAELLSSAALSSATLNSATNATAVPMYRVRVHLNNTGLTPALTTELAASLKAGMQLEGTLTLEERKFYEWVLEPLLGIKGRF
jgi:membrane fusion protein